MYNIFVENFPRYIQLALIRHLTPMDGIRPTPLLRLLPLRNLLLGFWDCRDEFPKQKDTSEPGCCKRISPEIRPRKGENWNWTFFPAGRGGIKLVRRWKFLISSRHRAVILNNPFGEGRGPWNWLCTDYASGSLGLLLLPLMQRSNES